MRLTAETYRRGDWMQTFKGRKFFPLDPRADEVFIDDIAHALAQLCRFGGHCLRFYSVAEHSVLVARAAPSELKRAALLHDATEAYAVDIPRPLKHSLPDYRAAEDLIGAAIAERFAIPLQSTVVKVLDRAILVDEARQNMAPPPQQWAGPTQGLGITLQFWTPAEAEREFLAAARDYGVI